MLRANRLAPAAALTPRLPLPGFVFKGLQLALGLHFRRRSRHLRTAAENY